jgi:transposase InsO family protein
VTPWGRARDELRASSPTTSLSIRARSNRRRASRQTSASANGSAYRSLAHAIACRALKTRHLRTRSYRPRTNGKAERFIRTMLAEWAYGAIYASSAQRTAALSAWLEHYNYRRPHGALSHQAPASRLRQLTVNNLLGSYT